MSIFATTDHLARIGPFQLDRKNYAFGHGYRITARFGCKKFCFFVSPRRFELSFG